MSNLHRFRSARVTLPAAMLAAVSLQVYAADWPSRTVVALDGFAPGGGTDILMRLMAAEMTKTFGQQVIVENRSGASGHIAAQAVARAKPDGHTIMIHAAGITASRVMYPNLDYDLVRDLAPITMVARIPNVLIVHPALPVRSVAEFVALAKRRPGELVFAATSLGSMSHMVDELFRQQAGIRTNLVAYRGGVPATTAVIAGEATYAFNVPTVFKAHADAGKLRTLAVSTIRRSPVFPDVPTLDESGLKGIDVPQWFGIWAPAKTPPAIIDALNREIVRVMALPQIRERFQREAAEPVGNGPAEFSDFVRMEVARWSGVARRVGLKPEGGS